MSGMLDGADYGSTRSKGGLKRARRGRQLNAGRSREVDVSGLVDGGGRDLRPTSQRERVLNRIGCGCGNSGRSLRQRLRRRTALRGKRYEGDGV